MCIIFRLYTLFLQLTKSNIAFFIPFCLLEKAIKNILFWNVEVSSAVISSFTKENIYRGGEQWWREPKPFI